MKKVKLKAIKTHDYEGEQKKKGVTYTADLNKSRFNLALGRAKLVKSKKETLKKDYNTRDMKAEK